MQPMLIDIFRGLGVGVNLESEVFRNCLTHRVGAYF